MPVTPFHFGPGLLLYAAAPRQISFTAFIVANVLIDLESAYFLFTGGWPVHRVLHTFSLAPLAGLAAGWLLHRSWAAVRRLVAVGARPSRKAALLGGLLGGVTHALLDGIMHSDMQPFWPFATANPMLGAMGLRSLHLLCIVTGLAGVLLLIMRGWRSPASRA